jgi:fatty acid elongase 3
MAFLLLIIFIGFVYFASYTYFTSTYWPWIPNAGKCAGEEFAAFSGCGILSSYLLLFISFYFSTYKLAGKRAAKKAVANGNIAIDPKFSQDVVNSIQANGNGKVNGSAKKNGSVRSRKA